MDESINQWMNQLTNQSISQSIKQTNNQSINQSVNQALLSLHGGSLEITLTVPLIYNSVNMKSKRDKGLMICIILVSALLIFNSKLKVKVHKFKGL